MSSLSHSQEVIIGLGTEYKFTFRTYQEALLFSKDRDGLTGVVTSLPSKQFPYTVYALSYYRGYW